MNSIIILKNKIRYRIKNYMEYRSNNKIFNKLDPFGHFYKIVPVDNLHHNLHKVITGSVVYLKGFWFCTPDEDVDDALFRKELGDLIHKHFGESKLNIKEK